MLYSLKRILLLRGLNHAPAIWLQTYTNLLHFLSFRLSKTMTARRVLFCCCSSGRLSFMRRLRRYASGGHFIRPYIFMLFWACLASPGASFSSPLRLNSRALPGFRVPLFYAQAAEIRVRRLFHMILYTSGVYFLCAVCVDPCLASFWPFPGAPLRPPGVSVGVYFVHRLRRSASANTYQSHLPANRCTLTI